MKKMKTPSARQTAGGFAARQSISVPIIISFTGHVIFCIFFILLPQFSFTDNDTTRIINVQLVSMGESLPAAPMVQEALPQATPAEALPAEVPPVAESVSPLAEVSTASVAEDSRKDPTPSTAEPEKKQSMKKRTLKPDRVMESAIKNVEKSVETSQVDQRQQALDRIRQEVAEQEAAEADAQTSQQTTGSARLGEKGGSSSDILRIYYAEVAFLIQKNWAFSDQLAGNDKDLINELVIIIGRTGAIEDIWFDTRSGNSYFDDSTYKAVLKSGPLPPIPDGINENSLTMGFRFDPDGLK